MNILLLNGPNLNLQGKREPDIYGYETLDDIVADLEKLAGEQGATLTAKQSNYEGELIETIHKAGEEGVDFILINPGAFTHTSIALRDAFLGVGIPFIEVHLSNLHARESFRQSSYLSDIARGVIVGLGIESYRLALLGATAILKSSS